MNQTVLEGKKTVVSEIENKFKNSGSTVVAEYRGLSVAEVTELRRALRAEGVEMKYSYIPSFLRLQLLMHV